MPPCSDPQDESESKIARLVLQQVAKGLTFASPSIRGATRARRGLVALCL